MNLPINGMPSTIGALGNGGNRIADTIAGDIAVNPVLFIRVASGSLSSSSADKITCSITSIFQDLEPMTVKAGVSLILMLVQINETPAFTVQFIR